MDWILLLDFMMRFSCALENAPGLEQLREQRGNTLKGTAFRPSIIVTISAALAAGGGTIFDKAQTLAGRILGLDVGDRRIGVAVSDELGLTAQPVLTLVRKNRRQDLGSLARLVRKYGCAQVVVGNPLYMSGDVSPQALKAQALGQALHLETGAEITLWDERLSTTEAHRHLDAAGRLPADRRAVIDQVAAVLILQSFLDSRS